MVQIVRLNNVPPFKNERGLGSAHQEMGSRNFQKIKATSQRTRDVTDRHFFGRILHLRF